MSFSGLISNAAAMFDMDKMREEILAEEEQKAVEQTLSQNKETVTHRSDALIAKKRRELKDIPVVSASSLLSPDEARKLSSFTTKGASHPKPQNDSKGKDENKNAGHKKKLNSEDSINYDDDVEIDIDSDMSDDEITYLKKKKRLERETVPEPVRTSGRYVASAMFSRSSDNSSGANDNDDASNTSASSMSFDSIRSFVSKHINLQLVYFSAVALFRQAKKVLEEYKMIVWLVLSSLLVYKFLF